MAELWTVDKEKTQEHWLEVADPEGWYHAVVKWDGCIELERYFNIPATEDPERSDPAAEADCGYHICDLDAEIARLQALKAEARKHFGEHWPY
jgi:hypothetical protein